MFKLISMNINHSKHLSGLTDIIRQHQPHIINLQEVPHTTEELQALLKNTGYIANVSLGDNNKPGNAVLHPEHIPAQITTLEPGRIQRLETDGHIIYNIYGPSGTQSKFQRKQFFNTLLGYINLEEKLPILLGDWNCVINKDDTENNFQRKNCPDLKSLINLKNYQDCYKLIHSQPDYTFNRQYMSKSRLDRIYLPPQDSAYLEDCHHLPTLSDHKAVMATLNYIIPAAPGRTATSTYWKLNAKILNHPSFNDTFQDFWEKQLEGKQDEQSWADWWDGVFKENLRKFLQCLSKERMSFRRSTRSYLYQALETELGRGNWNKIHGIKEKLRAMMLDDMEGIIIRSGDKEIIDDERGSIYHLSREVKRAKTGNLDKLIINNQEETNKDAIEKEIMDFYEALYNGHHRSSEDQPKPVNTGVAFQQDSTYLEDFLQHIPSMNEDLKEKIQEPLKLEEILEAIESASNNKSPGLDGITNEFYKATAHQIGPTLLKVFQEQLDRGYLTESGKEGVTRLIPKVTTTPTIQELRPITLLACDYKLMSKVIATRLNNNLPNILHSSQLCTRDDRSIISGAGEIISAIEYANERDIPAYILSLDAYKAFDKANVNFIIQVMERMGFGETFISWIKTLHRDVGTRFIMGHLSRRMPITSSLRQGDNVAMPLFLINMEPVLTKVNLELKGLQLGPTKIKDLAYVDDVQIISEHIQDQTKADEIFKKYESISGIILSREKTKIMGIGAWTHRNHWPLKWQTSVNSIKAFGITYMPTIDDTTKESWKKCSQNINSCINSWKSRRIDTLSQRTFILKTYALSKMWYLAQVLPLPRQTLTEIEKKCRTFLWQGRLEHLAWDELITEKKNGGLNFPSIQDKCDSLFLKQLHRCIGNNRSATILGYWIGLPLRKINPGLRGSISSETTTAYYRKAVELIQEAKRYDIPEYATTKQIYLTFTSTPPTPKIQVNQPDLPWNIIYSRVWNKLLTPEQQDLTFTIINNIYPTKERLNRMNKHPTGLCGECNTMDTNKHHFITCQKIKPLWEHLINNYQEIMAEDQPNPEWIYMIYKKTRHPKEKQFLISRTIEYIHNKEKDRLNIDELMAHLKMEEHHHRARSIVKL